ncbi:hypothetical protein QBC36DRAFT_353897 [Triangularia setosa]|uniref:Uncharacterized protein n=1 Tax=Triangularia setosa TaxID=2587417 RepID=A0AAN7AAZ5_9PEZI|nr:hypothetical protein QBC36DRAFT_353897 [Podospora setosa]
MKSQYRRLTLKHERQILTGKTPDLKPGEASFHSFYIPPLNGGPHEIIINQTIEASGHPKKEADSVSQKFVVIAPRFSLPPQVFDSVFPPPGHSALPKTLPHIVLRDPQFPWVRDGSIKNNNDPKNCIPWVALIAFTADELQLSDQETADIVQNTGAKVNENLGFDLKVSKVKDMKHSKVLNAIPSPDAREAKDTMYTSVICPRVDLFKKLFAGKDGEGDVSRYKYLAHVRQVATDGMVSDGDDDAGLYSIVMSHRLGPLEVTQPTPVMVHLVSLEEVENFNPSDLANKDRVLLTSLYSWTYTSLPPDSFDVRSALEHLGEGVSVLHTSTAPSLPPQPDNKSVEAIVAMRQRDGYTLVRHRTVTGEETASIYRGPLVPRPVTHPLPNLPSDKGMQSNFGSDLQILDSVLSLMDISYASAWQLGKTLAMGDQAFTAALSRVRGVIHGDAVDKAKKILEQRSGGHLSRDDTIGSISDLVAGLRDINAGLQVASEKVAAISTNRWMRPTRETIDTTMQSPHMLAQIYGHARNSAHRVSLATNGTKTDFHKIPSNTDYAVVQDWILDKLHLHGIPVHYLIPDPSYLPQETLRFFYIDENWTDAFVDGALSLGNSYAGSDPKADHCRTALKEALNDYLAKPRPEFGYCQQMPKYGFLLRTQVLSKFPDLIVAASFANTFKPNQEENAHPKAPILIQRKLESDVMMCLFDRMPGQLVSLEFTLPPHQQSFIIGENVSKDTIRIVHKKIYTGKTKEPNGKLRRRALVEKLHATTKLLDWSSRTMKVEAYATEIWDTLTGPGGMNEDKFTETSMTSAILALQLNEPIHALRIEIPSTPSSWLHLAVDTPFQFQVPTYPSPPFHANSLPPRVTRSSITPTKIHRPVSISRIIPKPLPPSVPLLAPPTFTFGLYPVGYPNSSVPNNTNLPMDLIVRLINPYDYSYTLTNITVRIPCGSTSTSYPPTSPYRPLISKDYDCPPPTMLSNLRFNVLKKWEGDWLVLEVVPRKKEGFSMQKVKEASFMLSMVDVLDWKGKYTAQVVVILECEDAPGQGPFRKVEEVTMEPGVLPEDEGDDIVDGKDMEGDGCENESLDGDSERDEWEVMDGRRQSVIQARA